LKECNVGISGRPFFPPILFKKWLGNSFYKF
jgi:hypothetical protein